MARLTLIRGWHVFHKRKGVPYRTSNSLAGIHKAKSRGYKGIDLDLSMDADGLAYANHWPKLMIREGFRDPFRKIRTSRSISQMRTAEVKRLRVGSQRVLSLAAALRECKRVNITACLEIKGDRRFNLDYFTRLRAWCDKNGSDPIVMTLPQGRHGIQVMQAAKRAGFRTMWLYRGRIPESYYAHLTYVKKGGSVYRVEH